MNKLGAIFQRKVLGLKVLYWVGIFVVILGIYAWRMRVNDPDGGEDAAPAGDDVGAAADAAAAAGDVGFQQAYPTPPSGTVVVAPPVPVVIDPVVDNDLWQSQAVGILIKDGISSTQALRTVTTFLDGGQLSIVERGQIEFVLEQIGQPPAPSYAGQVSYRDVLDPVSPGVPNAIKYVSLAGKPKDRWIFRDDNTLQYLTEAEWKGLGRPYVKPLPATHVVWTYPITRPNPTPDAS